MNYPDEKDEIFRDLEDNQGSPYDQIQGINDLNVDWGSYE